MACWRLIFAKSLHERLGRVSFVAHLSCDLLQKITEHVRMYDVPGTQRHFEAAQLVLDNGHIELHRLRGPDGYASARDRHCAMQPRHYCHRQGWLSPRVLGPTGGGVATSGGATVERKAFVLALGPRTNVVPQDYRPGECYHIEYYLNAPGESVSLLPGLGFPRVRKTRDRKTRSRGPIRSKTVANVVVRPVPKYPCIRPRATVICCYY